MLDNEHTGERRSTTYSERQLEAVLPTSGFDHFTVYAGKGPTHNYVTAHERDVIRPHVFGRFRHLLGATAQSPCERWKRRGSGSDDAHSVIHPS